MASKSPKIVLSQRDFASDIDVYGCLTRACSTSIEKNPPPKKSMITMSARFKGFWLVCCVNVAFLITVSSRGLVDHRPVKRCFHECTDDYKTTLWCKSNAREYCKPSGFSSSEPYWSKSACGHCSTRNNTPSPLPPTHTSTQKPNRMPTRLLVHLRPFQTNNTPMLRILQYMLYPLSNRRNPP